MNINTARSIHTIRHADTDFDAAWRLANNTDAGWLTTCAAEADVNAVGFYEQADNEEGPARASLVREGNNESNRAATLRAAVDFITYA